MESQPTDQTSQPTDQPTDANRLAANRDSGNDSYYSFSAGADAAAGDSFPLNTPRLSRWSLTLKAAPHLSLIKLETSHPPPIKKIVPAEYSATSSTGKIMEQLDLEATLQAEYLAEVGTFGGA
jgi:hypothetical protein